ncbi:MAG: MCP four helix bundle domain-containing protein [Betaproteobacteria bacterium]|nr:MCP four helix bundle domain-containing protein [Betaproteobacteria bacterium]
MNNLPIGTRLGAGFGVVILGIAGVGAAAFLSLNSVKAEYDKLSENYLPKVLKVQEAQDNTNEVARSIRNIAIFKDAKVQGEEIERIKQAREANNEIFAKFEKEIVSPRGKQLLKASEETRKGYSDGLDRTLAAFAAGKDAEGKELLLNTLRPAQIEYQKSFENLGKFQQELMKEADQEVDGAISMGKIEMGVVGLVAALLGAFLGWWIARSVTRPLGEAMRVAETIAAGDLTSRIEVTSKDETGRLLESMKKMNENLAKIVGEVRHASDSIATGSSEIANGTQDLSSRTEEQASNLEETAASMEELTATVKQSAESARQANQLAANASAAAASGGKVVSDVVKTMESITSQSHKIAEITNVIDGIAFQTNILALNASVEAARAGEQGRGFAVVAGEVRSLAQRAAQAAKEIKTLIGASVEQIENGGQLVHTAGTTMDEIVRQVKQVSDLIGEITAASQEEGRGIGQINDAVVQLDQVTQQNAALVEQSAAAADSLKHEAEELAKAVSIFRVNGTGAVVREPAPVAKPAPKLAARASAKPSPASRAAHPAKPAAVRPPEAKASAAPPAGGSNEKDWEEF